jgi:hypothetical protein
MIKEISLPENVDLPPDGGFTIRVSEFDEIFA